MTGQPLRRRDDVSYHLIPHDLEPSGESVRQGRASRTAEQDALFRALEPGHLLDAKTEGLRPYFEVQGLDAFCAALAKQGVLFDQMPKDMPWGWRHAHFRDPDGHQISLYRAGKARLRQTATTNRAT